MSVLIHSLLWISALTLLKPSTSLTHALGSSAFTRSQSLGLWSTQNTHCHSLPQLLLLVSPRIYHPRIRHSTTSSVACEPKNPHYPLDTPWIAVSGDSLIIRWPLTISPWDGSLTIRSLSRCEVAPLPFVHYLAGDGSLAICPLSCCAMAPSPSACCLTRRWLPCYLLTVSPWKDLIAICCSSTASPWGDSLTIRLPWGSSPQGDCPWVDCLSLSSLDIA
jgi:hypothetical protein